MRKAESKIKSREALRLLLEGAKRHGKRIVFASNMANQKDPAGFDLFLINEDGTGLQRITYYPGFDAFPMVSSDGKRLVWASNRNGRAPHETNIFIADWVP